MRLEQAISHMRQQHTDNNSRACRTNFPLARAAYGLPIQIGEYCYQVQGTAYEAEDLGLIICYPNPLAPDHYLAVYAGQYYGDRLPVNHKFDLLPDFIIFSSEAYDYDDANYYVRAGFFDMNWQLDERLTQCGRRHRNTPLPAPLRWFPGYLAR